MNDSRPDFEALFEAAPGHFPSVDPDLSYRFERALLALDRGGARRLIEAARAERSEVEVIEAIVAPALEHVGRGWEAGTVALSQVYMGGRLCEEIVNALLPGGGDGRESEAPIAIATLDDYHLLGKRIVLSALRASGFAVRDYGRGTAAEIAERALADGIEILLLSTLMLPAALRVREVRSIVSRRGAGVRLVVGGAPFRMDARLAEEVGADASGTNTADAISIVRGFTGGRP
jgi:methanogenic corrinoid protein MtbC1